MAPPDDDAPEAFDDEPTHMDEAGPLAEQDTRAYKSVEFLAGREAGFAEGVEAAVAALRNELVRARCTEEEIKLIIARVRAGSASGA
jgi:hypothetical protein